MDSPNSMPQGKGISRVVQVTLDRLAPLLGEWTGRGRGELKSYEASSWHKNLSPGSKVFVAKVAEVD